jgi:large subunit ribosomal protein L3
MNLGLVGKKVGMTQIFKEDGEQVAVTVISAGPCTVICKRTQEKEGYCALQLGYEEIKPEKLNKPEAGYLKKNNAKAVKHLKEFRLTKEESEKYKIGDEIKVSIFEKGSFVDVTAKTIGRGFTGVIKRYDFNRFPQGHGTHEFFRHGGSIGCRFPQRVDKGKRMPGHYGNEKVTTQNLEVMDVIEDQNLVLVRGSVPGHKNSFVNISRAIKKKAAKK